MRLVVLDAFIQISVYTLTTRFLQVRVLCRYFYNVNDDSHQVVCRRDYIQQYSSWGVGSQWVLGAWVSDRTVVPRLLTWGLGLDLRGGPRGGHWGVAGLEPAGRR